MNKTVDSRCKYHGKCAKCGRSFYDHNNTEIQEMEKHRKYNGYSKNLLECENSGGFKVRSPDLQRTAEVSAWRIFVGLDNPFSNDEKVHEFTLKYLAIIKGDNER